MEEIKVGDYIRSNDGYIGKITRISQNSKRECDKYYSCDNCMASGFYEQIKKHSKNIIDLIEIGDYVNGYRIDNIINGVLVNRAVGIDRSGVLTPIVQYEQDIKTILTHEQFEQNCYKV